MPRVALSVEKREEYKINDLPFLIEKKAEKRGLSQKDLAKALGITPQALGQRKRKRENGKPRDSYSYGDLLKVCRILDLSEEEKLGLLSI